MSHSSGTSSFFLLPRIFNGLFAFISSFTTNNSSPSICSNSLIILHHTNEILVGVVPTFKIFAIPELLYSVAPLSSQHFLLLLPLFVDSLYDYYSYILSVYFIVWSMFYLHSIQRINCMLPCFDFFKSAPHTKSSLSCL